MCASSRKQAEPAACCSSARLRTRRCRSGSTCEAMWILASAQSTSVPFIQILPVPGNDICCSFTRESSAQRPRAEIVPARRDRQHTGLTSGRATQDWMARRIGGLFTALSSAERAPIGAGVERLAALPAEPRRRRFARAQPRLDALRIVAICSCRAPVRTGCDAGGVRVALPRRQHIVEQVRARW